MKTSFKVELQSWRPTEYGPDEIRSTSAFIKIIVKNVTITEHYDVQAKSVADSIYVSAYPLAMWFVSSWWRIIFEPDGECDHDISREMSHWMQSSGHGYLWPSVKFGSDGSNMHIQCHSSASDSLESVRYLKPMEFDLPVSDFISGVDDFVTLVIDRLNAIGLRETDLHELWKIVSKERSDTELNRGRRLEACLGFDPDEGPDEIYDFLSGMQRKAGYESACEIAPVVAGQDCVTKFKRLSDQLDKYGIPASFADFLTNIRPKVRKYFGCSPWEAGWAIARIVRSELKLNGGIVNNKVFSEVLCAPENKLFEPSSREELGTIGICAHINENNKSKISLLLSKPRLDSRRFELSRFLCDYIIARDDDNWLPATKLKTVRQKIQRAFAAEFLSPKEALVEYLDGDYSEDAFNAAAEHFKVSPWAIGSHLKNNNIITELPFSA